MTSTTTPDAIVASNNASLATTPGISWRWLLVAAIMFTIGAISALIVANVRAGEQTTFSTPSLLGFFFGIALSAASTVLAVAAISLGKASEQAIIQRSEESIRLQNEVFVRTTDALARIESSTGVTEKRIEDIISGRAGDLSHAIAQRWAETSKGAVPDRQQLEKEIRASLMEQLTAPKREETASARREAAQQAQEAQTAYRKFQSDLLVSIANSGFAKCERLGDGQFAASGRDLFDIIVTVGDQRIAISTFSVRAPLAEQHVTHYADFLRKASAHIPLEPLSAVLLVFDGALKADGRYAVILSDLKLIMKTDLAEKLVTVDGKDGGGIDGALSYLKGLSDPHSGPRLAHTG